jgi:hypothetical protein
MLKNITTPLAVAAVNALALPATATTAHAATGCGTGPATHSSTRTRAPATPSPLEAQGGLRVDFAAWKGKANVAFTYPPITDAATDR